ncbi:MAG: hypothetical protein V4708_14765 [Bacteroidota bacterium]
MNTYYKISIYENLKLINTSDEVDNYIEYHELAIKRCEYWHREKLLNKQLLVIKITDSKSEVTNIINPPIVFAVITKSTKGFKNFLKNKKRTHGNFVGVHIRCYDDIGDKFFDYSSAENDSETIPDIEKIITEVTCRCRSAERQIRSEDNYRKRRDIEDW